MDRRFAPLSLVPTPASESGEPPAPQGATTDAYSSYAREEQRSGAGWIAASLPIPGPYPRVRERRAARPARRDDRRVLVVRERGATQRGGDASPPRPLSLG